MQTQTEQSAIAETLRVFCWATSWCTYEICDAVRPTDAELQQWAEWYRPCALYARHAETTIKLQHINWCDFTAIFGERKPTHSFPGCDNRVWVLAPADEAAIMALEAQRAKAAADKVAAEQAEKSAARGALIALAASTGKDQVTESWMADCDGSVRDCSFDLVAELVRADGSTYTTRTHCY